MPGFVQTCSPLPLTNLPHPIGVQTARSKCSVTRNRKHKRVVSASLLGWPQHGPKQRLSDPAPAAKAEQPRGKL